MTDRAALLADENKRLRAVLELCLEFVGAKADQYGTASTAGPLLGAILRVLGRPETADEWVVARRERAEAARQERMKTVEAARRILSGGDW